MDAQRRPACGSIKKPRRSFHVPAVGTVFLAIILSGSAVAQQPPGFATCLACHSIGPDAEKKNGPVLNGIAGKPAGAGSGFTYSEAFQAARAAGLVWSDENLDKFLADPAGFMPGSRMAWAVSDAAERRAIVSYLKTLP